MAKVVVVVEGSQEEVRPLLAFLSQWETPFSMPIAKHAHEEVERKEEETTAPQWTEERVLLVWNGMSDGAQRVLREIAKRPDGYVWKELAKALGRDARSLGGSLSSVGHQLRRQGFTNLPMPVRDNPRGTEWVCDLDAVWQATLEKLDKEEAERKHTTAVD